MTAQPIATTNTTDTTYAGYAHLLPKPLTQDYQAARADPNAISLADEIALLRTFLGHYLSTFQEEQPITADALDRVAKHVEKISRLVARQARLLLDDPQRVIRDERLAWTKQVRGLVRQVFFEFLPEPYDQVQANKRLNERLREHNLLDDEPVHDTSSQPGSPFPSEERVRAASAGAPLVEGGQGVRQANDTSSQNGSTSLASEASDEGTRAECRRPEPAWPGVRSVRPRQCRAHDHTIMRRCEHPAVPDTGRCERHQDVPEVALYSPRS